ncbi:MAG: YebC/PmpR family DNA-binding transcriptional regulator [Bacteroidales bacterium]|jgi:YebC/PmpR family DNA-binding regulatory protein|nr:YebC/PmpR family DNA-binding transcriptional regulator [Bacteroidales bacterium]MCU0407630.1 YebC/PmpR family DNA-binding transcriptional regulator [Bacteroidales bacterium]
MGRAFEYRRASKEKRWDKMSKLFPKLAKNITIAAKEGGSDPELNAKLRTAILNAKAQNMPKDNIEAAIKRASGKDSENFAEITYEGKGPHGVLVFVECATDNNTRTVANIKSYFNKYGGGTVPTGSLEFMFSRKAVFELDPPDDKGIDDIELELIESGLEEIEKVEDTIFVYGDYTNFGALGSAIESLGLSVKKASLKRIALNQVEVTEEQLADIEKLIDKIEDDDDVQAVYTNIA